MSRPLCSFLLPAALLGAISLLGATRVDAQSLEHPNVVVILADDL